MKHDSIIKLKDQNKYQAHWDGRSSIQQYKLHITRFLENNMKVSTVSSVSLGEFLKVDLHLHWQQRCKGLPNSSAIYLICVFDEQNELEKVKVKVKQRLVLLDCHETVSY